jgi:hypothetical protein
VIAEGAESCNLWHAHLRNSSDFINVKGLMNETDKEAVRNTAVKRIEPNRVAMRLHLFRVKVLVVE